MSWVRTCGWRRCGRVASGKDSSSEKWKGSGALPPRQIVDEERLKKGDSRWQFDPGAGRCIEIESNN